MDTMESSPLAAPPLARSFDEMRADLRAAYLNAVSDVMERCLEQVILPDEQANLLFDFAMASSFMAVIKVAEIQAAYQGGTPVSDRKNIMKLFKQLLKTTDDEVPKMLMLLVDAVNAGTETPKAEETEA